MHTMRNMSEKSKLLLGQDNKIHVAVFLGINSFFQYFELCALSNFKVYQSQVTTNIVISHTKYFINLLEHLKSLH